MKRGGLAKFRQKCREVGVAYAWFILVKSILPARILSFNSFHVRETLLEAWRETPGDDVGFRAVTAQDAAALSEFDEYSSDVVHELARGSQGFVLEKDGEIIASTWYTLRDLDLFGWAVLRLPDDGITHLFITVKPNHRGHKYHNRIKRRALDTFTGRGIVRQISVVETLNRNSLRASARSGSHSVARITYLRVFDWKCVRYQGVWRCGRWTEQSPLILEL